MATEELKTTIHTLLAVEDDPDVLAAVLALLQPQADSHDFADDFTPEDHAAVQEGIQQLAEGKGIPAEEVFARYGIAF